MSYLPPDATVDHNDTPERQKIISPAYATTNVLIIDTAYTAFLLSARKLFIDFDAIIDIAPNRAFIVTDIATEDATPEFRTFLARMHLSGYKTPKLLTLPSQSKKHGGRVMGIQSVISQQRAETRGPLTFTVITNAALIRNVCKAMSNTMPNMSFIFVEHKSTYRNSSHAQRRKHIILDSEIVFPKMFFKKDRK